MLAHKVSLKLEKVKLVCDITRPRLKYEPAGRILGKLKRFTSSVHIFYQFF